MSDSRLDKLLTLGTDAARLAFTPSPPPGVLVVWLATDTGFTWAWNGSAWVTVGGPPAAPGAFVRAGVDWVDSWGVDFASGTIDCSHWSGGATAMTVGQSILSAFPSTADCCGIWQITALDTGANTADVVLRADSVAGKRFYAGEIVYDFQRWISYIADEATTAAGDSPFVEIGADPANYLEWNRWQNHVFQYHAQRYGNYYSEFNASNTLYAQTKFAIVDATSANVVMTLQAADVAAFLDDWDGRLYSREHILKRIDSSGHTVTVAVQTGEYLDGVLNGTTTIAAMGVKRLMSEPSPPAGAPQKWWIV